MNTLPQLNSTLRLTNHEPMQQRIIMNYNLEGMTKEEGKQYIIEKLKGERCNQTIFEDVAIEAILNATDGTPHLTNKTATTVCLLVTATKQISLQQTSLCRQ